LQRSLLPTSDTVFLTWHDINFTVPNKGNFQPKIIAKNENEFVLDIDYELRQDLIQ
jgi:hypothetical protein